MMAQWQQSSLILTFMLLDSAEDLQLDAHLP